MTVESTSFRDVLKEATVIGAMRGLTPIMIRLPMETVKAVQQAENLPMLQSVKRVFTQRGFKGFYPDFIANSVRTVVKQAYRYPALITIPHLAKKKVGKKYNQDLVLTGLAIALFETGVTGPLDRIKNATMTSHGNTSYLKFIQEARTGSEGLVKQAYRGAVSDATRRSISWSVFLISNRFFSKKAKERIGEKELPFNSLALVTGEVTAVSTLINVPFDVVRTRIQATGSKSTSIIGTFRDTVKREGVVGLTRGWQANMWRYFVHTAFSVPILAYLQKRLWNSKK